MHDGVGPNAWVTGSTCRTASKIVCAVAQAVVPLGQESLEQELQRGEGEAGAKGGGGFKGERGGLVNFAYPS